MPRYTLRQLYAIAERRLSRRIGATEKEITLVYAQAREDIRAELSKAYERYAVSGELTRAEMTKYNRLTNIEKSLTKRLNDADAQAIRLNRRLSRTQYEEAFFNRAWAIDQGLDARLTWGRLNDDAVRAAVENPLARIADRRLRANSRERIRATLESGLTRGDTFAAMSREISSVINGSRKDAIRISRTEGQRAQAMGAQRTYERADELGVEGREYWMATLDDRTRDRHGQLDGHPKDEERGGWRVPGTNTYTPGPLQSGIPSFNINCRCTTEYRIDDEAPSVRRIRGEGVVEYQTYEQWDAKRRGNS